MQNKFTQIERLFQRGVTVFLKLPHEPKARNIGEISGGVYRKFISPRKHTHNKSNSVGFNYRLIRDGGFRYVCVHIGTREYWTLREFILAHGFFQHYKKSGFERQILLNYSMFGIERARKWYDEKTKIESKRKPAEPEPLPLFAEVADG